MSINAHQALGEEGFAIGITAEDGSVEIRARTASGALYGSFRFLSYLQRGEEVPQTVTSVPAMKLRVWDLWDVLDGGMSVLPSPFADSACYYYLVLCSMKCLNVPDNQYYMLRWMHF